MNNYYYYLIGITNLADQLQRRFAYGAFDSGGYQPTSTTGSATLNAKRLTHYFGASLADNGFTELGGRQYYAATVTMPIYHYADDSDASELVRGSDELLGGLNSFIQSLSYATVEDAYESSPGETTRSVSFSMDGCNFSFGVSNVGLGDVGINSSQPHSGSGTITLQVTLNGSNYIISQNATIDLTIHDVFDFDYFKGGWKAYYSDSSCSAAMIQCGFGKTGSNTNAGQVALIEIEVDGNATTNERTLTQP